MRQYRGIPIDKPVYSEEWVYGWYYHNPFSCVCQIVVPINATTYERYAVHRSTLGQSTGLCDKNGKEIYEGDIYEIECAGGLFIENVKWEDRKAGFYRYDKNGKPASGYILPANDNKECNIKVIGTVHSKEKP